MEQLELLIKHGGKNDTSIDNVVNSIGIFEGIVIKCDDKHDLMIYRDIDKVICTFNGASVTKEFVSDTLTNINTKEVMYNAFSKRLTYNELKMEYVQTKGYKKDTIHYSADITEFTDISAFLSNFYDVPIKYMGRKFLCAEGAYQASKCANKKMYDTFTSLNGSEAKKLGRSIEIIPCFEDIKITVMHQILKEKFNNLYLDMMLGRTGNCKITEGNYWHDNFWGVCKCDACKDKKGLNVLGMLLMKIRKESIK